MMIAGVHLGLLFGAAAFASGAAYLGFRAGWFKWWRRLRLARRRALAEDAVKYIHNCSLYGTPATLRSLAEALGQSPRITSGLLARLEAQRWVECTAESLVLTPEGTRLALQVIRAHRLWERYLADEARMPLERVHAEADRREHAHTTEQVNALDAAMGHPPTDPHGAPIPTNRGKLVELSTRALSDWPAGRAARIVHLEDEPPATFARIAASGLAPGQIIRVLEADVGRLVLAHGNETHMLPLDAGANIFVEAAESDAQGVAYPRLTALEPGQRATVVGLADALRGFTRRRLLDLGFTPGVAVEAEMAGIFSDPVAYRVRGALVALRHDQAGHVLIRKPNGAAGAAAAERGKAHHA